MTKVNLLLGIRVFLTLAFVAAGLAKLLGVPVLVAEFGRIGLGQWFRYVTGAIEVGAAVLMWVPGYAAYAACAMICVAVGALLAHAVVLGMASSGGAALLLVLALIVLNANRGQRRKT